MEVLNTMGIKRRIISSGRKFIKKHLSFYNSAVGSLDGSGALDDEVQKFAKVHAMALADNADGTFTATLTVHGDLEQSDKIQVTIDGSVVAQATVDSATSGIAGTVGIDTVTVGPLAHATDETIEVKMEILRGSSVIEGSSATGSVAVTGNP